ncbi:hypothetical protein ACIF8T_14415 [Streptomyces sp. NPDC085946]|uniref:hypothetical protein n=1 Tax=Streptomyces sp. NPDC085946 TaxID=3365744 RepID=UPI0037D90794
MDSGKGNGGDRPERRPQDSLWAIGLLALAVGFVLRLAFDGMSAWPYAAVSAVFFAGWTVWLVRRRRRHDASAAGTEPDDVPAMERQVLKGEPPPRDPERRRAMAAFVASRQERLRRGRWWALPLLAVLFFGMSALWFAAGSVTAGGLTLVLAVVFMTWMTWWSRRYDHRLTLMRRRLQS